MFTGIVTAIGTVREMRGEADRRAVIACPFDPDAIAIGASIACSGVCLTVVDRGAGAAGASTNGAWFAVDISGETIARTAGARWQPGSALNLEQALRLGDELGGHIVTGHVDGVGTVAAVEPVGESLRVTVAAPAELAPYLAAKGSITVDGVSLTVNTVADRDDGSCAFSVNLIPHTGAVTTLGTLGAGDAVNLEIDVLARYLMRMQQLRG